MSVDISTLGWAQVFDLGDRGEPSLPDRPVEFSLSDSTGVVLSGLTDANGLMTGFLASGQYTLTVVDPKTLGSETKVVDVPISKNTFGNGADLALQEELHGDGLGIPPLDSIVNATTMTTAESDVQFGAGFFGMDSVVGGNPDANNVTLYAFARESRTSGAGGCWGLNAGVSTWNADPASSSRAAEFDINNFGADSGSTFSGAINAMGISIASGGPKRAFCAVEIDSNNAPFYYGMRFNSGAVYDGGASIQSLAASATHVEYEARVGTEANVRYKFNTAGRQDWGPGGATAVDTYAYRSSPVAQPSVIGLLAGPNFISLGGTYLANGSVGQILSFFGAGGTAQAAALTLPAATAATNSSPYGFSQAQADALITVVRAMGTALHNWGLFA